MSEGDYVEPSSESFWEVGQYKRTVKRAEDGHKLCSDIVQMISERADLEKAYSKSLKAWSKKWTDYLSKGNEYGSMKGAWQAALVEADKLSEIHLTTHNALNDELNREFKDWQKQNYQKSLVGGLKITKEYEEEFKKAQKPWSKKYFLVEKTKKEYHGACKSYQSAKVHLQNSHADQQMSPEQRKKLEDKVEKYKKEVEIAKNKYKQALDDLNSYNSRYIEDMNNVYKKCDQFEKERLEFFIQKLLKLHTHLNIYEKMNIEEVYNEFMSTIRSTNPDKDLHTWSKECGAGMAMNWPMFEEYSEQVKQIAKSSKKSDKDSSEGVTMTSIKHIDETDTKSLSISANDHNNQSGPLSSNSRESNPFGEFDEDDDSHKTGATNSHHHAITSHESDDEERAMYLNVRVRALYDYQSAEDDELSFKAGEEFIKLANEDERGWCLGKIGNRVGLYPATYATEF